MMSADTVAAQALYATLGLPDAAAVAEVRLSNNDDPPRILPGATTIASLDELDAWAASLMPGRKIVVYGEDDGEGNRQCARSLTSRGWQASSLQGGLREWIAAGLPTVRTRRDLPLGASRWVTRERPKIDRLACPWLVRRFIDPGAQFFYVPAHSVRVQAEALGAQPFDIADVTFSHRGPLCSFDAFLNEFDLHDPVLDEMAAVVRAADTGELSRSPQAHGLLAISLGLSANIADDILLLEQAMPLYDALYAWCKTARQEAHSWPQKTN